MNHSKTVPGSLLRNLRSEIGSFNHGGYGMAGLKKFFSEKLSYLQDPHEQPEGGRFSLHFLKPDEIRKLSRLFGRTHIGLVTLEIKDFFTLTQGNPESLGPQILDSLEFEAVKLVPEFYHHSKVLFPCRTGADTMVIFFEIKDGFTSFASATHLFRLQVHEKVNLAYASTGNSKYELLAGYSHIEAWRKDQFQDSLFRAYCQARRIAAQPKEYDCLPLHDEFQWLMEGNRIKMLYQPVISFEDGSVMGWEAFMRGPETGFFHLPELLFKYTDETGESLRLDRHCRHLALSRLGDIEDGQHLFINVHPSSLSDPNFTAEAVAQEVRDAGLQTGNVILEFTERHRVHDMQYFIKMLETFRLTGFHIAVDDVGTGQSSLRFLSQLRPDYIKIDISIIDNIDSDPFKRVLVESLAFLAHRINSRIIAVGIQAETEFSSLVSMGIYGGQGNYLALPSPYKSDKPVDIPLKATFSKENLQIWKCSLPIRELASSSIVVPPHTPVKGIKELLKDKPPQTSVVVVQNKRPVGLLMQYSMDRSLSTQFGMSLYYSREVSRIMDMAPLVVDETLPMEEVARKAMERDNTKIYDDIIVTSDDKLLGVVSVQRMLDTLAQKQVELAKGANPLSGLPGNVSIETEIEARAKKRTPTSLIYVDLDNFKVYNDVFGFERGDRIILLTAHVLGQATTLFGNKDDFVGHVGGDDFVILANPERAATICEHALREFASQTPTLYRREDLERGYIIGKGRDGKTSRYPLASLSIGVVDCDFSPSFNMEMLSNRVAEVKKAAKELAGNSCVRKPYHAEKGAEIIEVATVPSN